MPRVSKATKTVTKPAKDGKPTKKAWDVYSDAEKAFYLPLMNELSAMRDNYRQKLIEFDDLTYLDQYEKNRKADLGYNVDVDDPSDFRVTTGLTREKDTTILSTLVNFNLQPDISAFDKDNAIIAQLGEEMEDLVEKSRELESYEEKRQSIYRELIAQGTVYAEEVYIERRILKPYDTGWTPAMKIADFKEDNMPLYDVEGKCEAKLHLGKYVLVSSMNEEELQNNNCVATYEEIDWDMGKAIYGSWERWELVPRNVVNENPFQLNQNNASGSDYIWNTFAVGQGKLGITKVYHRFSNRYMIILNGVMMLPISFPMTKMSPSGLYPIAKGVGERIPNFAFGKGIPSKTRVDQKLYDTLLRAMVGKAWQSYRPALGNRSGNVLSRDIVNANQITHGIKQNDIFPILPQQLLAVTNGDVSMFEMIKQVINEKSVTDSYAGQTLTSSATATEVVNQQKQTMLKLSALVDGVRSLEKRLVLLRIYNIIANWTTHEEAPMYNETVNIEDGIATITGKEIDPTKTVKKYKNVIANTTLADGKKGVKNIKFIGDGEGLPSQREQIQQEDQMANDYGKPARITYINAEWLRNLQAIWNVDMIVSSDTDDHMQLLMYIDNLTRISELFGVQVFKADYVLGRIAMKMDEDYDKMFSVDNNGAMADMMKQLSDAQGKGTQVDNPAQQIVNAKRPTPLSVAKVT